MQKSILITGCSSGIGYRACQILKERGYHVFATARKLHDVERLRQQGFDAFVLDVANSDSIVHALASILAKTNGTLDALFNNAGFGQAGALEDISRESMRQQFETNVFGLHELTARVIPIMRKQGHGRIINVSSVLGIVSLPYRGAYNASKYAVEGLSDTLRLELHHSNIFVSLIEPGPIISQFRDSAIQSYHDAINAETSVHQQHYQRMLENRSKNKDNIPFSLEPDAVVKKVIHALESRRPKERYYVTLPTYFMGALKRLLPTRLLDKVLLIISRGDTKE